MGNTLSILILAIQSGLAFAACCIVYMALAVLDYHGGLVNFFGLLLFQPLMAMAISAVTVVACIVIGLPLRLNRSLRQWWEKRFYISFVGIAWGIAFLTIGTILYLNGNSQILVHPDEITTDMQTPVLGAGWLIAGWFILPFFLVHLFPPSQLRKGMESILSGFVGRIKRPL